MNFVLFRPKDKYLFIKRRSMDEISSHLLITHVPISDRSEDKTRVLRRWPPNEQGSTSEGISAPIESTSGFLAKDTR